MNNDILCNLVYEVYNKYKPTFYNGIDYTDLDICIKCVYESGVFWNASMSVEKNIITICFNIPNIKTYIEQYNCDPEMYIMLLLFHELAHYDCYTNEYNFGEIEDLTIQTLYNQPMLRTTFDKFLRIQYLMDELFVNMIALEWVLDIIPYERYNEVFGIVEYVFEEYNVMEGILLNNKFHYPHSLNNSTPLISPILFVNKDRVPYKYITTIYEKD